MTFCGCKWLENQVECAAARPFTPATPVQIRLGTPVWKKEDLFFVEQVLFLGVKGVLLVPPTAGLKSGLRRYLLYRGWPIWGNPFSFLVADRCIIIISLSLRISHAAWPRICNLLAHYSSETEGNLSYGQQE